VSATTMSDRRVLVLDAGLQHVGIMSLKRAFVMLFAAENKAESDKKFRKPVVLEYSRDGAVVGAETKVPLPSVIQLGHLIPRHRRRARFCRKNVLVGRDRGICQYCFKKIVTEELTMDHVVPRVQGGQTTWENVVACCIPCNQKKAGRTPEQAHMKLLRRPTRPNALLDVTVRMDIMNVPEEWRDYWNVELTRD
jgi:hypothetical protein